MFTKIYWIDKFENGGAIGIMPRPRGNDWLADEVKRLKETGVNTIVSLLEKRRNSRIGIETRSQALPTSPD